MPVLRTTFDVASDTYRANRDGLLALLAAHEEQVALACAGGGERYVARHRARGKLTVRERIELLLDRGAPFLELSPLAAWGTEFQVGASIVTGVGVVSGVECLIIGHDPTVRGGTMNPYTLKKNLRALEVARVNRLPVVNLVESGGADLPTQGDLFVPAGQIFHDLTQLSALGIASVDLRVPFDPRDVIARVVDGSRFDEYKARYGPSLVTGWASIHGYPVGILANAQGVLFMDEAKKATEFILLANQTDIPLVFLQN